MTVVGAQWLGSNPQIGLPVELFIGVILVVVLVLLVAAAESAERSYWSSGMLPVCPKPGDIELAARSGEGMIHWIAFESMSDVNGKCIGDWQTAPAAAVSHVAGAEERTIPAYKNLRCAMFSSQSRFDWARCFVMQGYPMWVPAGSTKRYFIDPQRFDRNLRRAIGMHDARPDVYPDVTSRSQWGKRPNAVGGFQKFLDEFYGSPADHIAHCKSRWQMPGESPRWATMSPGQRFTLGFTALAATGMAASAGSAQRENNRLSDEKGLPHTIDPGAALRGAMAAGMVAHQAYTTLRLKSHNSFEYPLDRSLGTGDRLGGGSFIYSPADWDWSRFPTVADTNSWASMPRSLPAAAPVPSVSPVYSASPTSDSQGDGYQVHIWVQGPDGQSTPVAVPDNMGVVNGKLVTFQPVTFDPET